MSTPSIALIPSGYKEGLLYSQLPINGDGDLDFARTTVANRVNQQGVIEEMAVNVPRLDYFDGGCPSLLLEPASTNLWVNSEGTDATLNSPLGEFGFTEITNTYTSSDQNLVGKTVSMFFLVKKSDNSVPIIDRSSNPNSDVVVRLAGSSNVSTQFTTTNLGNGFYLAKVEDYAITGTNTTDVRIINNSGVGTFISIIQLEELPYSTSYIPTNGSTETRTADSASKSGLSNYINSQEGVLFTEIKALSDDGINRKISLSNGSDDNAISINLSATLNTVICSVRIGGGAIQNQTITGITKTNYNKIAFKYSENDFSIYINGVKKDELLSGSVFSANTLNKLSLDRGNSADLFYGKVKDLRVYTTALTDTELIDLTS